MYDRSVRDTPPSGALGRVDLHGENGVQGHTTQYYSDGHRVSWDGDGQTDQREHWTNQNVPKGSAIGVNATNHHPMPGRA